jgi:hypothetical protein
VEEGGEEALGLTQRLTLHRTQTLYSVNQGRELNAPVAGSEAGRPGCGSGVGVGRGLPFKLVFDPEQIAFDLCGNAKHRSAQ